MGKIRKARSRALDRSKSQHQSGLTDSLLDDAGVTDKRRKKSKQPRIRILVSKSMDSGLVLGSVM